MKLAGQCDLAIVVGSPNSSNSGRLKEVAVARGVDGYLIDGPDEIEAGWLDGKQKIGVTAGASAPEILVKRVVDRISLLIGAESHRWLASTRVSRSSYLKNGLRADPTKKNKSI